MNDLIYLKKEDIEKDILKEFPKAKLESHWDEVHEYRTSVEILDEDFNRKKYFKMLISSGISLQSLIFQFLMLDKKGVTFIKHRMKELGIY